MSCTARSRIKRRKIDDLSIIIAGAKAIGNSSQDSLVDFK